MNEPTADIGSFKRNKETKKPEGTKAVEEFMAGMPGAPQAIPGTEGPASQVDQVKKSLEDEIGRIDMSEGATYVERLKAVGITPEEAAEIVDSLLEKGYYERPFQLTKKHAVTLRSRTLEAQEVMQGVIEHDAPQYAITINETISKYNLAASLAEFRGRKFPVEDVRNTLTFVKALPLPVFTAMVNRLAKFDAIMNVVLSEGVVENF
jgi:hypothetical protein